jgi:hypothetical protein
MDRDIFLVESRPKSPEFAATYHRWYEETHIPEILAVEGFVGARRLESVEGGSFLAIYDLDIDPEVAEANLAAARAAGNISPPEGLEDDPPPVRRYFRQLT